MRTFYSVVLLFITIISYAQVHVRGYYRKDGTYVRPHERTAPNSTVTYNYSYPGNYNPNLEYNTPLPKTVYNYNQNNSTSSYDSEKEWVNGYYRSNGTYVNGYYRTKRKAANFSNSDNYPPSTKKKYVNTTKVNFRTSPDTGDNIIAELSYADEVSYINTTGYWDKVSVKKYDPYNNRYLTLKGYINSRYLTENNAQPNYHSVLSPVYSPDTTESNRKSDYSTKYFKVTSMKAYFHSNPNVKNRMKAYLIFGEIIAGIAESKYFVYTEFINSDGIETVGWILKDDLILK